MLIPSYRKLTSKSFASKAAAFGAGVILLGSTSVAFAQSNGSLQTDLNAKKAEFQELQDKATVYRENLKAKQQEKTTLSNQVEILDQNISLTETEIYQVEVELDELDIEQQQLQADIDTTQKEINSTKDRIAEIIKDLYSYSDQQFLEIALRNVKLSEFSAQVQYTETLNKTFQESLQELTALKREQKKNEKELEEKATLAQAKQNELDGRKSDLIGELESKNILLSDVEEDEEKFQALVDQVKKEQIAINAQITEAERKIRQKIEDSSTQTPAQDGTISNGGTSQQPTSPFALPTEFNPGWPIDSRRVTATFADPTYPYRNLFEHGAIDIGTPHGSPIRAADAGVVSVVRYDGSTNYAYVSIVHANGFSTLYGHVSQVYVQPEQVVQKGELIAASGATPGTAGAGAFTTGPHLHFEVKLNGVKVDPLIYLP